MSSWEVWEEFPVLSSPYMSLCGVSISEARVNHIEQLIQRHSNIYSSLGVRALWLSSAPTSVLSRQQKKARQGSKKPTCFPGQNGQELVADTVSNYHLEPHGIEPPTTGANQCTCGWPSVNTVLRAPSKHSRSWLSWTKFSSIFLNRSNFVQSLCMAGR